jgi:hypothetical protein
VRTRPWRPSPWPSAALLEETSIVAKAVLINIAGGNDIFSTR